MALGIRGKLFVLSFALIAIAELAVGLFLEHELRTSLQARIEGELRRHASVTTQLIGYADLTDESDLTQTDALADRIADATGARITLVAADGTVLGDSRLTVEQVRAVDNHGDRPEIREAGLDGRGVASRYSDTVDTEMLYVAVPFEADRLQGFARAALPLTEIEAVLARLRWAVFVGGLIGLMIAGIILFAANTLLSKTLKSMVDTAQAVAAGRRPGGEQVRLHHDRGKPRDAEIDGLAGSLNKMAQDLERTMAMLAAERNRFETVLQTMDQAVLALDTQQRVTTVNRAARSLLRLSGEVEGRTLLEAVRVPALRELVGTAERGGSTSAEFDLSGGPARRVQARATVQSDGGTVIVVHDVTEVRRLERVRRDFVANVSHELRTPISVIRANTETLLEGALDDPARARQFVDALFRHADRLGRLVSDLLDISRIEAGRYRLDLGSASVSEAAERVLDTLQTEADQKRVELTVDVSPDIRITADAKALEHVLMNLVGNAIKYTPEGGHVDVKAEPKGDDVRVEVLDDGPGIDPAHRERIFERFYRVDPGRSRDMGGTGLGLSIAKHLVEAMEGEVGVDPRSPHGSVFWFRLARGATNAGLDQASGPPSNDVPDGDRPQNAADSTA